MTSNTHIGKAAGEPANTAESGKTFARKRKPKAIGKAAFQSVPKHRAFVPLVTIWSGLSLALITAVLPDLAIARAISLTGVFLPLLAARLILAFAIGLAGALFGFIAASAISRRAKLHKVERADLDVSATQPREVEPIDPTEDLGSESLDAPIAQTAAVDADAENDPSPEPQLGELARRGFEMEAPDEPRELTQTEARHKKGAWPFTRKLFKDAPLDPCEGAACEASPSRSANEFAGETMGGHEDEPSKPEFAALTAERIGRSDHRLAQNQSTQNPIGEKPLSLDLQEFASLPQREGVWVEQSRNLEQEQNGDAAVADMSATRQNGNPANGLEKLRQTPASDLSLVEMVERFAAALHDRQAEERAALAKGQVAREAALAEALKALSLFTEGGFDQDTHNATETLTKDRQAHQTEDSLRSALTRLQNVRGAA